MATIFRLPSALFPRLALPRPASTFPTQSSFSTATNRPFRPPKRKRGPKKPRWKGLDVKRLSPPASNPESSKLPHHALATAFNSLAHSNPPHNIPALHALLLSARHHSNTTTLAAPHPALAHLLQAIISHSSSNPTVNLLSASGSDLAVEALFRLAHRFDIRPDPCMLRVVLHAAAMDPIVERRSQRALSVLKYLRAAHMPLTPDFVFDCFRVCVSALDARAAAVLMDFAINTAEAWRSDGFCENELALGVGRRRYLNGLMFVAVLTGDLNTAVTAYHELERCAVGHNDLTDSLLVAMYLKGRQEADAIQLFKNIRNRGSKVFNIAYAALIRAAGERGSVEEVLALVREFVKQTEARCEFEGPRGLNGNPWEVEVSERAALLGAGDAIYSAFVALRMCMAGKEAYELLQELGDAVSKRMSLMVLETCWRSGRADLATVLREEMEGTRPKYSLGLEAEAVG
eukprot:GFKZ01004188.1.p1 GENE.GFKZ01004188.1~~GFKZ01004188.1.p1  ORF type:complete len:460 (+),score=66.76 GFKZ01004188.1:206-1585(+)